MEDVEEIGKFPFAGPAGRLEIKKVRTKLYGGIWAPETLPELMHLLVDAVSRSGSIGGWRGQSRVDWRLDGGAIRRVHRFGPPDLDPEQPEERLSLPSDLEDLNPDFADLASAQLEEDVLAYEQELLEEARLIGHGYFQGRQLTDLELLGMLQHYGAATRLIDLSRNAFVALYFACADHQDDYGLLIGLDTEITGRVATEEELRKPIRQLLSESKGYSVTWSPRHLFERMRVQQSYFIFSQVKWSRWGSIALTGPTEEAEGDLSLIAISPSLKADGVRIQQHGLFGYDGKSLFPDLEGFSRFSSSAYDFSFR